MDTAKVEVQRTSRFFVFGAAGTSSSVQWPQGFLKPLASISSKRSGSGTKATEATHTPTTDRVSLVTFQNVGSCGCYPMVDSCCRACVLSATRSARFVYGERRTAERPVLRCDVCGCYLAPCISRAIDRATHRRVAFLCTRYLWRQQSLMHCLAMTALLRERLVVYA